VILALSPTGHFWASLLIASGRLVLIGGLHLRQLRGDPVVGRGVRLESSRQEAPRRPTTF
jgi:hypothetical protein